MEILLILTPSRSVEVIVFYSSVHVVTNSRKLSDKTISSYIVQEVISFSIKIFPESSNISS